MLINGLQLSFATFPDLPHVKPKHDSLYAVEVYEACPS